jgi:hypothetical protein
MNEQEQQHEHDAIANCVCFAESSSFTCLTVIV